jgi:hypothetical protein
LRQHVGARQSARHIRRQQLLTVAQTPLVSRYRRCGARSCVGVIIKNYCSLRRLFGQSSNAGLPSRPAIVIARRWKRMVVSGDNQYEECDGVCEMGWNGWYGLGG